MNAREEILARVRRSLVEHRAISRDHLETGSDASSVVEQRATSDVLTSSTGRDQLADLFVERVEDYRATVHRCSEGEVEAVLADLLGGRTTVVPEGFGWTVPHPVQDTALSATELDALEAVVTTVTLGIAETGTIVLTHGPGQGRRALSLVPDLHVCVVREEQVVPGVPDAVAALDPARPQTWISGPSATSDIELNRVEGVHGPRTLRVVLVGT